MTNYVSHAADSYIDVEDFVVGDCAEVHYTAPTARGTINLESEVGDTVLHCDYNVCTWDRCRILCSSTRN